jgi:hypothetical protein
MSLDSIIRYLSNSGRVDIFGLRQWRGLINRRHSGQ